MDTYQKILFQYWGYSNFRSLQEEVIRSVCQGNDTLALMPTGGGKSITFQVPALAMDGICIVVTPLIALMKDQVENLRKRDIKALMIHSGMTAREIDITLDNACFGKYKFLYLSPERLQTDLFKARVQRMKVNLLAIDESHCISQWGYDFRPSYLEIAEVRKLLPNVPVLALTATATAKVVSDIMLRLAFRSPRVLQKSFERKNLVYIVRNVEDKHGYLLRILQREQGCGIVYARNRGKTKELALMLQQNGISADFYHAGLTSELRNMKQDKWKSGEIRVIVATNAFGMGIDKPDVRVVVHVDLPDSLEAYFQEAGRAGRDEQRAYAVLLYNKSDEQKAEQRIRIEFPEVELIKQIYQAACNYKQIPYGAGKDTAYDFSLTDFSRKYKFYPGTVFSAFKFLQQENLAQLTEDIDNPSRVLFEVNRDDLYKIQIKNPDTDKLIKSLLRAYTGLFSNFTPIDEEYLARVMTSNTQAVYQGLLRLSSLRVISYIPRKHTPLLILLEERLDERNIRISAEHYAEARKRYTGRIKHILHYAASQTQCRSQLLLTYFGETATAPCGQCDVCKAKNELNIRKHQFDQLRKQVETMLNQQPLSVDQLLQAAPEEEQLLKVIRWLIDHEQIVLQNDGTLKRSTT